jgi:hypothetical protein
LCDTLTPVRYAGVIALVTSLGCGTDPATVTLSLPVQASVVEFRADGGDWVAAVELSHSERSAIYQLPSADGVLAVACIRPDQTFQVEELFSTASDLGTEIYAPFDAWPQLGCVPPANGPLVDVSGRSLNGGQIYIGAAQASGGDEFYFKLPVTTGTHDLIALGTVNGGLGVLVRHDQPIFDAFTEPDIDVGDDGSSFAAVLVSIDAEEITTELDTQNGTQLILRNADPLNVQVVPPDQLADGDIETVRIDDGVQGFLQSALVFVNTGTSPPLELEEPRPEVAFRTDAIEADWTALPLQLTTVRVEYAGAPGILAATATIDWIGEHHAQALAFDASFPGFEWPLAPAATERTFTIADRELDIVQTSQISEQ